MKDIRPKLIDLFKSGYCTPQISRIAKKLNQPSTTIHYNIKKLEKEDADKFKTICNSMREDGKYIEAGENDNLIVQKLQANPKAVGIFGFSFLDQNADKVKGSAIEGVDINFENIAAGKYSVSRPLYVYVKKEHVGTVKGIEEFVTELTSDAAWGDTGYLAEKGMIPMPAAERQSFGGAAKGLKVLESL